MEVKEISIQEAKLKINEALFVDVRDIDSYEHSHIGGAIHLSDSSIDTFVSSVDKSKEIIVYCYHGNSSLAASSYLMEKGFISVSSMSGGFTAWENYSE